MTIHCHERDLRPGDVLPGQGGTRWMICHIAHQPDGTYHARMQNLATHEQRNWTLQPGHGLQPVVDGPKCLASAGNVWINPNGKRIWKGEWTVTTLNKFGRYDGQQRTIHADRAGEKHICVVEVWLSHFGPIGEDYLQVSMWVPRDHYFKTYPVSEYEVAKAEYTALAGSETREEMIARGYLVGPNSEWSYVRGGAR